MSSGSTRSSSRRLSARCLRRRTASSSSPPICAESTEIGGQEKRISCVPPYLCKADLVTGAVVEFTSVQGTMGSYYALAAGENDAGRAGHRRSLSPSFLGMTILLRRVSARSSRLPTSLTPSAAFLPSARIPPVRPTRSPCAAAPSASSPCSCARSIRLRVSTLCPPSTLALAAYARRGRLNLTSHAVRERGHRLLHYAHQGHGCATRCIRRRHRRRSRTRRCRAPRVRAPRACARACSPRGSPTLSMILRSLTRVRTTCATPSSV